MMKRMSLKNGDQRTWLLLTRQDGKSWRGDEVRVLVRLFGDALQFGEPWNFQVGWWIPLMLVQQ